MPTTLSQDPDATDQPGCIPYHALAWDVARRKTHRSAPVVSGTQADCSCRVPGWDNRDKAGVPPGATVGVDMLTRKIKEVDTASGQLAMTYQLLEEKQSTLAKTAQRGYRTDQPISFLEPQPNKPSVYGLAEDRLPKPKWSTERETIPVAGARARATGQAKHAAQNQPRKRKRIQRNESAAALRGLLNQLGTESANMISKTMLAGLRHTNGRFRRCPGWQVDTTFIQTSA